MDGDAFDRRCTPRSEQNGMGCTGVTQELVDAFYMNDGYPVQETSFLKQSTLRDLYLGKAVVRQD